VAPRRLVLEPHPTQEIVKSRVRAEAGQIRFGLEVWQILVTVGVGHLETPKGRISVSQGSVDHGESHRGEMFLPFPVLQLGQQGTCFASLARARE